VTAVAASPHLSERLHVPLRSPLILLNEHVFNEDGTVVAYSDNYFVPGEFRLSVVRR
jgi:DNA-binding GntR family transcriptional regulator